MPSCEDEPVGRDYPRIKTLEVTNITEAGATFTGEIFEEGNEEITEHGFVWATRRPEIEYSKKVLLGSFSGVGKFSAEIRTDLAEGITYQVAAFVISGEFTVYGEPVTFKSLGSEGTPIAGFSPERALCGNTITITGSNLSWAGGSKVVRFSDAQGQVSDPGLHIWKELANELPYERVGPVGFERDGILYFGGGDGGRTDFWMSDPAKE